MHEFDLRKGPRHDIPSFLERDGNRERLAGSADGGSVDTLAIAAFAYAAVVGGIAIVLLILAIASRDVGEPRQDNPAGGAQAAGVVGVSHAAVFTIGLPTQSPGNGSDFTDPYSGERRHGQISSQSDGRMRLLPLPAEHGEGPARGYLQARPASDDLATGRFS